MTNTKKVSKLPKMKTNITPPFCKEILIAIENGMVSIHSMPYGIKAEIRDYDKGSLAKPGNYKTDIDGRAYVLQEIETT